MLCRKPEVYNSLDRGQPELMVTSSDGSATVVQSWIEWIGICRNGCRWIWCGLYGRTFMPLGTGRSIFSIVPESFVQRKHLSGAVAVRGEDGRYLPQICGNCVTACFHTCTICLRSVRKQDFRSCVHWCFIMKRMKIHGT